MRARARMHDTLLSAFTCAARLGSVLLLTLTSVP